MRRRDGFTLIELLVVIAVITILLMLAFPALRGIREVARKTNCQHNLTQIYGAIHLYADAYRDILPDASVMNHGRSFPRHLHNLLRPYIASDKSGDEAERAMELFHCPSDGPEEYFDKRFGTSYQTRGDASLGSTYPFGGQPFDYYPSPGELGIVRDGRGWHRLSSRGGWTLATTQGQNVVFLDGHMEYFGDVKFKAAGIE